jgi:adenylate kinase
MAIGIQQTEVETIKQWLGSGSINIFGMPFAGKDTQGRRIAELLDAPLIGGGDILRSSADQEKVKAIMSTGELFPSDYYLEIILPYLSQPALKDRPLILSSVGRWHGEEQVIIQASKEAAHTIKAVIYLDLNEKDVWKRFEATQHAGDRGQRHDDAEHLIETRLSEFRNKTIPVLRFYKSRGILLEIDGSGSPDEVTKSILQRLYEFAKS